MSFMKIIFRYFHYLGRYPVLYRHIMDEKTSIHILLNSLPYTRKEIVSSKYIGACVFTFVIVFTIFMGI
jgi:ABC-2 type transport system permease protein